MTRYGIPPRLVAHEDDPVLPGESGGDDHWGSSACGDEIIDLLRDLDELTQPALDAPASWTRNCTKRIWSGNLNSRSMRFPPVSAAEPQTSQREVAAAMLWAARQPLHTRHAPIYILFPLANARRWQTLSLIHI